MNASAGQKAEARCQDTDHVLTIVSRNPDWRRPSWRLLLNEACYLFLESVSAMVLIPGCDLSPAAPGGGGDTLTFARTPATLLRHLRHQQRSPELDTNLRKI